MDDDGKVVERECDIQSSKTDVTLNERIMIPTVIYGSET